MALDDLVGDSSGFRPSPTCLSSNPMANTQRWQTTRYCFEWSDGRIAKIHLVRVPDMVVLFNRPTRLGR